jgi:hypothetical protein
MYTQSEILQIARHCLSLEEAMKAVRLIRTLMLTGAQPQDPITSFIFIKRFRELT